MDQEYKENEVPRELKLSQEEFKRIGDILAQVRSDLEKSLAQLGPKDPDREWIDREIRFLQEVLESKFERHLGSE
ncbi:hypothetical protein A3E96_03945 [Candidatus Uhrbacteria bacterium RIFCSPHIGHO2_12_FULL_46_13]|nr:MAG: hypothetical protein A3E96_03945 [Candidatus Uhrbacteria bacterium RIFCSPHIGHO2_12_FULL_46_13]